MRHCSCSRTNHSVHAVSCAQLQAHHESASIRRPLVSKVGRAEHAVDLEPPCSGLGATELSEEWRTKHVTLCLKLTLEPTKRNLGKVKNLILSYSFNTREAGEEPCKLHCQRAAHQAVWRGGGGHIMYPSATGVQCKCRKSGCLKNYCSCFREGRVCDSRCKCKG